MRRFLPLFLLLLTAPALASPQITSSGLANNAVTTAKIANSAVTLGKQANLAANSIIGNNTGSPATPLALTVSQTRTLLGLGTGDSPTFTALTLTGSVTAHTFLGNATGSSAAPSFSALTASDLPNHSAALLTSGTVATAQGGTGVDNSTGGTANTFWARPDGSTGAATYRAIVTADLPSANQFPRRVANIALTGQTATITSTTLYAVPTTGTYRVSLTIYTTTAGSAGTATGTVGWNQGAATSAGTTTCNLTTTASSGYFTFISHALSSTNITYAVSVAGATGSPVYGLDAVVERLQ